MKLRSILFGLLFYASVASAADVITRRDGTTINAKVEEITETTIRYRKASNPTGPVYTIPIASVVTITYENGTKDTFDISAESQATITTTPVVATDEELLRQAVNMTPTTADSINVSDAELLRLVYPNYVNKLKLKAKLYRYIGWIGGGILVGAGCIGAYNSWHHDGDYFYPLMFGLPTVGVACCIWLNLRANQLKRQVREMEIYTSSIFENEILHLGDKSLTAGVSVMGNHMSHTNGYGLSLKLNF